MNKIMVHIDNIKYKNKPIGDDYRLMKPRLQNENTIKEIDITELMKEIGNGYAVSPAVMKGGCTTNNWYQQSLFMVDIDNNKKELPILKVTQAIEICKVNNIMPIFYYYTYSHTKDVPKYRLVFFMKRPVSDTNIREKIMLTLIDLFPQSDNACKNADRIFLGTNKQVVSCDLNSCLNVNDVFRLSSNRCLDTNDYGNSELNRLKANFNLLEYMSRDNDISCSTKDTTYFKNCSVCGHNDCLRYYHKSNTFYCFGANGSKGGSIIDYLMATEKLNRKQAINKFLNELCNIEKISSSSELEYFTAEELQNMDLPPVKFYVDGLIPQGLTLICSVPKLGKSWLSLQLCLALANGTKFLGFNTLQCDCLYLSLEDSKNRLMDRTSNLLGDSKFPNNLNLCVYCPDLCNGLIEELEKFISSHSNVGIIVIDTLQKIRGFSKSSNVYANDYNELSKLKRFADKYNIGIILIHHLKKGIENNDIFERVSGTNGITGTADTTLILSKSSRSDQYTQLSVVGRDVEFNEYTIEFDKNSCTWKMVGLYELMDDFIKGQSYNNDTLVATIKTLVENNDGIWKGTLKELNKVHKELYGDFYVPTEHRLKSCVNDFKSLLLLKDNIEYIPASKNPTIDGRIQIFKKINKSS